MADKAISLELFGVRNQDGKWFRAKGYGGYGETWVEEVKNAKLYSRIGQARSRVTFFASEWPEHGIPDLVRLTLSGAEVVVEDKERARKAIQKKLEKKDRATIRNRQDTIERAKRDIDHARNKIAKLRAEA